MEKERVSLWENSLLLPHPFCAHTQFQDCEQESALSRIKVFPTYMHVQSHKP